MRSPALRERRDPLHPQSAAMDPVTQPTDTADPVPPRPRQTWAAKFRTAFRGLKLGIRGQSSFAVHFFFTVLVAAAAIVLQCELWQWCVLLGCIAFVLTAELFNSAFETLFRGLNPEAKERAWPALDVAAGGVLMASLFAGLIGSLVLIHQLIRLVRP